MTTPASENTKPLIVITGSSGLIGQRLCRALQQDFQLVGLDVASPPPGLDVTHIETDLTEFDSVAGAVERIRSEFGSHIASVIHLAAWYDFSGQPSPLYNDLTVEGTRRLLRALREKDLQVDQFVFSSSLLVMKPTDDEHATISERSETRAEWAYPQSKLQAEKVIADERGSIPAVILRIAGLYDDECHSLPVSQQIARIHEKQLESYVFPGDTSHGQALVHLDDLTDCFRRVIERRGDLSEQELFLIAEPDVMSYDELQDSLGQLIHGSEWTTLRVPKVVARTGARVKQMAAGEDDASFIQPWMIDLADDHYQARITRARERLEWNPQHRLRDTLPKIVDLLQRDPDRFYQINKLPIPSDA